MAWTEPRPGTPRHEAGSPDLGGRSAHGERELREHARPARPARLDRARPAEARRRARASSARPTPGRDLVHGQAARRRRRPRSRPRCSPRAAPRTRARREWWATFASASWTIRSAATSIAAGKRRRPGRDRSRSTYAAARSRAAREHSASAPVSASSSSAGGRRSSATRRMSAIAALGRRRARRRAGGPRPPWVRAPSSAQGGVEAQRRSPPASGRARRGGRGAGGGAPPRGWRRAHASAGAPARAGPRARSRRPGGRGRRAAARSRTRCRRPCGATRSVPTRSPRWQRSSATVVGTGRPRGGLHAAGELDLDVRQRQALGDRGGDVDERVAGLGHIRAAARARSPRRMDGCGARRAPGRPPRSSRRSGSTLIADDHPGVPGRAARPCSRSLDGIEVVGRGRGPARRRSPARPSTAARRGA